MLELEAEVAFELDEADVLSEALGVLAEDAERESVL